MFKRVLNTLLHSQNLDKKSENVKELISYIKKENKHGKFLKLFLHMEDVFTLWCTTSQTDESDFRNLATKAARF